ncbi:MAG: glucose 1-dehydrogenase [Myxococcales bacterium]|nr:glucose 1-dehydrogenase [Myxococcales bacterium]
MRLKDKVAVVTGGGSGIGEAMCARFAAEGARVIVADVSAQGAEKVVAAIKAAGGTAAAAVGDISKEADAQGIVRVAKETFGRLDILCNNAGIIDKLTPLGELEDGLWDAVIGVNLTGTMRMTRAALPVMVEQGGGVILNTASHAGIHGGRGGAAYTASKHGVIGLTRSVAWFYADKKIRCNAICPGGISTPLAKSTGSMPSSSGLSKMQPYFPTIPPYGKPEEVAATALFLVSDEASYISGAALTVDGSWDAF